MNYYYISNAENESVIQEKGIFCNSEGYIPIITSLKDVDTYCHNVLMTDEYCLFRVNLESFEDKISESDELHSELRRQVKIEHILPEQLQLIGSFPISMKNYYLEVLKHQYAIARKADTFSVITEREKTKVNTLSDLVRFFRKKYFIPEGILHLSNTEAYNYINDRKKIYYYVAQPEEANQIRKNGIFSPSKEESIIVVISSIEDANHIAADLLKIVKFSLFRIKDEGITGDLFNPGIDSMHNEHRFMLLQDHIKPEHIEYLGTHNVNNEFYLLETLKYEYITANHKGEYNFLDLDGKFRSLAPLELIEYYKESVFPKAGISLSVGDILYYVERYKPLEHVS